MRWSIGVLAVLPALSACGEQTGAKSEELPLRTVRTAAVATGELVERVEVIGELQGMEEIRIFAQIPERIRSLAVKEGDLVKKGDLLATILGDLQSEAVAQAQAALDAALANRDAVADNLGRTRKIFSSGAGTKGQLEALEAQARAVEAQVRQATAALSTASTQQSRTVLRSPIDGVVAQVSFRVGDMASPTMPLMTVVQDSRVKAVLRVPERDFLRVEVGMPVRVAPLAQPDREVEGTVTLKGPIVDRNTRTGLVEIHLANRERRLVAGSAIRAGIELSRRSEVVLVPAEAVIMSSETERTGAAVVFVAREERAQRREVKVGQRRGSELEILDGLRVGDQLITSGAHFLRDNNPIRLAEGGEAARAAR